MKNRDKLTIALNLAPKKLANELDYFLTCVDHEEIPEYDIVDAFEDAVNLAEDTADKKMLKHIRKIYMDIGFVQKVEPARIQVSSGKKYYFKYQGEYYDCKKPWSTWITE